jgi:hypothetical protein
MFFFCFFLFLSLLKCEELEKGGEMEERRMGNTLLINKKEKKNCFSHLPSFWVVCILKIYFRVEEKKNCFSRNLVNISYNLHD